MTEVKNPKDLSRYGEIKCISPGCNNLGKPSGSYIIQDGLKLRHRFKLCFTHNIKKDGRYDRVLKQRKQFRKRLKLDPVRRQKNIDIKREWEQKRKLTDPNFRIAKIVRSRISSAISKGYKKSSSLEYLGCSWNFAREFYENLFKEGMTWDNHGEWHIDHIIPVSSFDLTNEEELYKCFNYTNTQPMWAKDNLSKGNKIL